MAKQPVKVIFHRRFVVSFKKRIAKKSDLLRKFQKRMAWFMTDPGHPLLRDHALTGDLVGKRSFSIDGDVRVVYRWRDKGRCEFMDIGSHNQVYR